MSYKSLNTQWDQKFQPRTSSNMSSLQLCGLKMVERCFSAIEFIIQECVTVDAHDLMAVNVAYLRMIYLS